MGLVLKDNIEQISEIESYLCSKSKNWLLQKNFM